VDILLAFFRMEVVVRLRFFSEALVEKQTKKSHEYSIANLLFISILSMLYLKSCKKSAANVC